MTNKELALGLFRQAESRFRTMKEAFQGEDYPYAVRVAQECVELSLKAALISAGIDPPKWHDVGAILLEHADRFSSVDKTVLEEIAFISRSLRGKGKKACMEMKSWVCPRMSARLKISASLMQYRSHLASPVAADFVASASAHPACFLPREWLRTARKPFLNVGL